MLVYVLVQDYVCVDSGDFKTDVIGVYETFGQAQAKMEQEMNDIRKEMSERYDIEEDNYVEGDMAWGIWQKGEFATYRCTLEIFEQEVVQEQQKLGLCPTFFLGL